MAQTTGNNGANGASPARAERELDARLRKERAKRRLVMGGGLLLAANFIGIGIASTVSNNEDVVLPPEISSLTPAEGSVIRPQDPIGIDLLDQPFEVQLFMDGIAIPEDEVNSVPELGVYLFRPTEDREFDRWAPGRHVVRADYVSQNPDEPPSGGTISWEITVG